MDTGQNSRKSNIITIFIAVTLLTVFVLLIVISVQVMTSRNIDSTVQQAFIDKDYQKVIDTISMLDDDNQLSITNLYLSGLSHYFLADESVGNEQEKLHYRKTVEDLELCLILYPESCQKLPALYEALGKSYFFLSQYRNAVTQFEKSKLLGNNNNSINLYLGLSYGHLDRNDRMEEYLSAYDPGNLNISQLILSFLLEDKEYEQALRIIDGCIANTDDETVLFSMCKLKLQILTSAGDADSAIQFLNDMIQRLTNTELLSKTYVMLGDLYREKGDLIEAHTMWNKAVTFDPKNPEANIRL